ncbi:MAG: phenylacetate-CoA oxygenase subunit PaaJ [Proteobacteria bacterium]|nr:phenylacetate-CoA oxygenase subunit PaaJ [Pseudomonadota bacterium]
MAAVSREQVYEWLADVPDPEIPVLSILDLGIVRDVSVDGGVTVSLSPTYSGCPATEFIESSVIEALKNQGLESIEIKRVLSPPWTTDWISDAGREKLREYGIAPPVKANQSVACPQCESLHTERVSEFGSTACKAAWRCRDCLEPFEYFKCL